MSDRQQQILDATLALVASEGMLNTSISKISKRAKCSPGIVYHYFDSKDEIMDTLYLSLIRMMTTQTYDTSVEDKPVLERYKALWLLKYDFHYLHPTETRFIEQYKNSSYFTSEKDHETVAMMSNILQMGQQDITAGLVVNLPLDVIYTMTLTVALNLAKSHIESNIKLDEKTLDMIAERVCRSVLA